MRFVENPFYLLGLSCDADRRTIVSACEEKEFLLDSEICANAQSMLLNPGKRLAAEMGWFISVEPSMLANIINSIEKNEPIKTDGLTGTARLNATLYNFSIAPMSDIYDVGYVILDIDEQFSNLDVDQIVGIFNKCHEKARIAEVSAQDIEAELQKQRELIRTLISTRLFAFSEEDYIELVTMIAEKCLSDDDFSDGIIISDVVDQYEIRMQSEIEEKTNDINQMINEIESITSESEINKKLDLLIERVKAWDVLAQPIQLKAQSSGMAHQLSEELGIDLRNLSIHLHNEHGFSECAYKLVEAIKPVFAELQGLSDAFDSDLSTLDNLIKSNKDVEKITSEFDALKKNADDLKRYATSITINTFITKVKSLDRSILNMSMDYEDMCKIRVSLCLMARDVAITLHNEKGDTENALTISKALEAEFSDLYEIKSKLSVDTSELQRQIFMKKALQERKEREEKTKGIVWLVIIGILVLIFIISAISSGSSSSSSNSKPSSSSSSYSSNSNSSSSSSSSKNVETQFSQSVSAYDKVYADVVSIEPVYGIGTTPAYNTDVCCKCKTSSGGTVWVYMSVSQYNSYIDSSANISTTMGDFEIKTYSSSKRIHGSARRADSLCDGLSSDTGTYVLYFSSID